MPVSGSVLSAFLTFCHTCRGGDIPVNNILISAKRSDYLLTRHHDSRSGHLSRLLTATSWTYLSEPIALRKQGLSRFSSLTRMVRFCLSAILRLLSFRWELFRFKMQLASTIPKVYCYVYCAAVRLRTPAAANLRLYFHHISIYQRVEFRYAVIL